MDVLSLILKVFIEAGLRIGSGSEFQSAGQATSFYFQIVNWFFWLKSLHLKMSVILVLSQGQYKV